MIIFLITINHLIENNHKQATSLEKYLEIKLKIKDNNLPSILSKILVGSKLGERPAIILLHLIISKKYKMLLCLIILVS